MTRIIGVAGFVLIALLGVALDARNRVTERGPTLRQTLAWLDARKIGRFALFFLWAFAGWHFFVR